MIETLENLMSGPLGDVVIWTVCAIVGLVVLSQVARILAAFTPGDADDLAMGKVANDMWRIVETLLGRNQ